MSTSRSERHGQNEVGIVTHEGRKSAALAAELHRIGYRLVPVRRLTPHTLPISVPTACRSLEGEESPHGEDWQVIYT
jgi:hypothetical protein